MQAELVIEFGQAKLITPVYLKPHAPAHIKIEIPEELIEPSRDWFIERDSVQEVKRVPEAQAGSLQERLNTILGPLAKVRLSSSIGEDHQMYMDALEERYFGH